MSTTPACRALGLATCLLLGACQAQAPRSQEPATLAVQTLHINATCGAAQPGLREIADARELSATLNAQSVGAAVPKRVAVDFSQASVFQLSMGQQASAGAGVSITSASVDPVTRRLTLDTRWQLPDPGRMHAMMITRPCVVFSVPRGDYRSARVLDAQGELKLAVELAR